MMSRGPLPWTRTQTVEPSCSTTSKTRSGATASCAKLFGMVTMQLTCSSLVQGVVGVVAAHEIGRELAQAQIALDRPGGALGGGAIAPCTRRFHHNAFAGVHDDIVDLARQHRGVLVGVDLAKAAGIAITSAEDAPGRMAKALTRAVEAAVVLDRTDLATQ